MRCLPTRYWYCSLLNNGIGTNPVGYPDKVDPPGAIRYRDGRRHPERRSLPAETPFHRSKRVTNVGRAIIL